MILSDYAKELYSKRFQAIADDLVGEMLFDDVFEYISYLEGVCAEHEPEPQEWRDYALDK